MAIEDKVKKIVWRVPRSLGSGVGKGENKIEGRVYSDIKMHFLTLTQVSTLNSNGRGTKKYESKYYPGTFLYFNDDDKTITMESDYEKAMHSWATQLGLKIERSLL
tara:strand:+ start:812 stop:1129 length:318 start_codon:yes stop_codon:yes gene_type:complete